MNKLFVVVLVVVGLTASGAYSASQGAASAAIFLRARDFRQTLKGLNSTSATDQPLGAIDAGSANIGVFVVHRPQESDQGCTIEHDTLVNDQTTSIFIVLDGAGTLVTGGKLTKPSPLPPEDPDLKLLGNGSRGSGIEHGESRRISKGDMVIIPAGVPHGFSAIEKFITYEVIRVDSGKVMAVT
jgi:hypothetical protein